MEHSRLLSLPKELRLEIWTYVLTDPSMDLTLHIRRKDNGLCTTFQTKFEKPRTAPINLHLLRTNQFIYDEAIPILYRSVRFYPCDLEGIFPLFLETVSPFAQSHIRFIKLSTIRHTGEGFHFHWALTCAQVAKLGTSLRRVDIEGHWPHIMNDKKLRRILNPLVKIKASKKLEGANTEHQKLFQQSLDEARGKLGYKPVTRKALTAAETTEELRRGYGRLVGYVEPSQKRPKLQDYMFREKSAQALLPVPVDEHEIANDLRAITGIQKFESDLEQWEMVNDGGKPVNPKKRTASLLDEETWTDAASTIIAKYDDLDVSKDREDWEFVSEPSSPV